MPWTELPDDPNKGTAYWTVKADVALQTWGPNPDTGPGINGVPAISDSIAPAGTVTTERQVTVVGVAATASSVASPGVVSSAAIVLVNGVPATASSLAAPGTVTAGGGVQITAPTNIQSVIDANPAGTIYDLTGTFTGQSGIVPKTGDTLRANGVAILDGTGATDFAAIYGGESPAAAPSGVTLDGLEIRNYTVPLYGANAIRHQGAVHGYTVDGSNNPVAACSGWTVIKCSIHNNEGWGVNPGPGWVVGGSALNGNSLFRNGACGVGGGGFDGVGDGFNDGTEISYNTIYENNHPTLSPSTGDIAWWVSPTTPTWGPWDSAGIKVARAKNWTISHNNIYDNNGAGIWCDIDCGLGGANVIEYNTVDNNTSTNPTNSASIGIYYEISESVTIRFNTITNHTVDDTDYLWGCGIYVEASASCTVTDNNVYDSKNAIVGNGKVRTDAELQADRYLTNLKVYSNNIYTEGLQTPMRLGVASDQSWDFRSGQGNEFKGPANEPNYVDNESLMVQHWWGINHPSPSAAVTHSYWESTLGFPVTQL